MKRPLTLMAVAPPTAAAPAGARLAGPGARLAGPRVSDLSYSRHDYFRRILCNLRGGDVEKGRLPYDRGLMGTRVKDICFHNAERNFQFS